MIRKLLKENLTRKLYENTLSENVETSARGLVNIFETFNKLSGNLKEDIEYITNFNQLLKEDSEFDPFSHLQQTGKINTEEDCVLTISEPNSKLGQINAPSLSLPAGYTCPFADICKSFAHPTGGKFKSNQKSIKDVGDIRCYAASAEMTYPNVRNLRWRNFDLIKDTYKSNGVNGITNLLLKSINHYETKKGKITVFRIHDSGDFFEQYYLDAWIETAKQRPDILFYAYTKSLPFWKERKSEIPKNLRLVASEGGKADKLIDKEGFRKAVIVKDTGEAIRKKLNVDVNDFLAAFGDKDFALLLHGVQSKESGATSQAKQNSKIIKDAAKSMRVNPNEIVRLLKLYTN